MPISKGTDPLILLVTDSDDDFLVLRRAFNKLALKNPVLRFTTAEPVLDYLLRRGRYADQSCERPALMLLDINLPGIDGVELLSRIKRDEHLRAIPAVMFTTSTDPRDIARAYAAGANSYIHKPVALEDFVTTMQRVRQYWLEVVLLPPLVAGR